MTDTPTTAVRIPPRALLLACVPFVAVTALALGTAGPRSVGAQLWVGMALAAVLVATGLVLTLPALARGRDRRLLLLAAGLVALSLLGQAGLPELGFFARLDRNWQGKLIDLCMLVLLFALAGRTLRHQSGLLTPMRPGSVRPVVIVSVVAVALRPAQLGGRGR